jgi:hypothetical protein
VDFGCGAILISVRRLMLEKEVRDVQSSTLIHHHIHHANILKSQSNHVNWERFCHLHPSPFPNNAPIVKM